MAAQLTKDMKSGFHQYTRQCALTIIVATTLVYANTFQVPFFFDDGINIIENPSIRGVPSVFSAFVPTAETGIAGRPLINFTLALNYAISGLAPWSYHLFNLLIHVFAALTLFGILRKTFAGSVFPESVRSYATPMAFVSALIWAIHPLQTQAVTYTIQRCESFMGLCFFLVFYFAIRGWQSEKQTTWHLAAVFAFLAGVGAKEVIIVAPVLLFYYDCLFMNHSPIAALKRSRLLYTALAVGIMFMVAIVIAGGTMSTMAGPEVYSAYDYWRTQPQVVLHYIRLAFWPSPLSIDYDWPVASWSAAWPACLLFMSFVILTFWSILKRSLLSFPAVWFLLILAPTTVVHLPDLAFEHRMYLSLAAIVVPAVLLVFQANNVFMIRLSAQRGRSLAGSQRWIWYFFILMSLSLCVLTSFRNWDYRSKISIWQDAALKYPRNSRAHTNLGQALLEKGHYKSALSTLNAAMRIEKEKAALYVKTAIPLGKMDDLYRQYLSSRGVYVEIENNLGIIYARQGDLESALPHFHAALTVAPNHVAALTNTGLIYIMQSRVPEATEAFEKAITAGPNSVKAYVNMGALLRQSGKPIEAIKFLNTALHLAPNHVKANYHMGMAPFELNQDDEAISYLQKASRLDPDFKIAREALRSVQTFAKSHGGTS